MDNIQPLVDSINNLFSSMIIFFDMGLNVISISLAWAGFIAGNDVFIMLFCIGLSFLALSYAFSAFINSLGIEMIATDIFLMVLGGIAYFFAIDAKENKKISSFLVGLGLALVTTVICLKRMGLGERSDQIFNSILTAIINSRLFSAGIYFLLFSFAFWLIFGRFLK